MTIKESTVNHERHASHVVDISAPAPEIFDLIVDVNRWPVIFGPTVHVETEDASSTQQVLRIWATANGDLRNWTSIRNVDPDTMTVKFRQVESPPILSSMSGSWTVEDTDAGSRVTLDHTWTLADDSAADAQTVFTAVDNNSRRELEALRTALDSGAVVAHDFSESVTFTGRPEEVLEFIWDGARWPDRLPHVEAVDLTTFGNDAQLLRMVTAGAGGSHTTESYRVRRASSIAYKQTTLPAGLIAHAGRWTVDPADTPDTWTLTSWHGVLLDVAACRDLLQRPAANPDELKAKVQQSLAANSMTTMRHATQTFEPQSL